MIAACLISNLITIAVVGIITGVTFYCIYKKNVKRLKTFEDKIEKAIGEVKPLIEKIKAFLDKFDGFIKTSGAPKKKGKAE